MLIMLENLLESQEVQKENFTRHQRKLSVQLEMILSNQEHHSELVHHQEQLEVQAETDHL